MMASNWKSVFHQNNLKLILQLLLLGLFLHIFGLPSLRRYQNKEVLVVTSVRDTNGLEAPAITVIVTRNETLTGWKSNRVKSSVETFCRNFLRQNQTIATCIEEQTYNLSEISQKVQLGIGRRSRPANASWTEDFTHSYTGRQYTLKITKRLHVGKLNDLVRISFQPNLVYSLFFHDEKYFYISKIPVNGPPSVQKIVDPHMLPYYYQIVLTEANELNVPNDPCNEDPDYNFNACVKESFSKRVGCRTKWDDIGLTDRPPCTKMSQFRCNVQVHSKITFLDTQMPPVFIPGNLSSNIIACMLDQ